MTGEIGDRTHLSAAGNGYCHHIDTVAILEIQITGNLLTIQVIPAINTIHLIQIQIKKSERQVIIRTRMSPIIP